MIHRSRLYVDSYIFVMGYIMKKILYISTNEINIVDLPLVLKSMGYYVDCKTVSYSTKEYAKEKVKETIDYIVEYKAECVFSYDFSRITSDACLKMNIPYVSWVYDCPQVELYSLQAYYDTNYIFVFDRHQYHRLKELGIKNVFHMPLAIYADRVKIALSQINSKNPYYNLVFIGQLYHMEDNEKLISYLDDNSKILWDSIVSKNYMKWEANSSIHGSMNHAFVEFFRGFNKNCDVINDSDISEQYYYEVAILSRYLAYRERTRILNNLCDFVNVDFFTNDKYLKDLRKDITIHPGISYSDFELFKIYNRSRININISLHCIESGLSQRIYDVMASGGFMVSNYQEEIEEQFEIGEEIIIYHNEKELYDQVCYYLSHEDERKKVALKGQEKVFREHSYENRIYRIMSIVNKCEAVRKNDYGIVYDLFYQSCFDRELLIDLLENIMNREDSYSVLSFLELNFPENTEIKLYLSNYMLEKGRYLQSLEKLEEIGTKNNEISLLIEELKRILQ